MIHSGRWFLRAAGTCAAALALTGCATPDRRTDEERMADQAVARRVQVALAGDRYLDAGHIDVQANRGVVRLSGMVAADIDQREALRVSASVPGVRAVIDDLELYDFGRKR